MDVQALESEKNVSGSTVKPSKKKIKSFVASGTLLGKNNTDKKRLVNIYAKGANP